VGDIGCHWVDFSSGRHSYEARVGRLRALAIVAPMSAVELDGVHAVVTGASSGLGAAMAEALLQAGATVAVAARPGERLEAAVEGWRERDLKAEALPLDVRDPDSAASAAATIGEHWPSLDLLVNNAGIGMRTVNPRFITDPQPFWDVPLDGFRDVVETNLTGYFTVAKAFTPLLLEQGRGRIVNVTINLETMRRRGFVPSRAGAESLSLIMTEDLRPHQISVNLLLPGGATLTGMIPEGLSHLRSGDVHRQARGGCLMGLLGVVRHAHCDRVGAATGDRLGFDGA
jgi:NAD(P)-dependent dehydrogenase (short-subunit alcohol dehydrogenase family)